MLMRQLIVPQVPELTLHASVPVVEPEPVEAGAPDVTL